MIWGILSSESTRVRRTQLSVWPHLHFDPFEVVVNTMAAQVSERDTLTDQYREKIREVRQVEAEYVAL